MSHTGIAVFYAGISASVAKAAAESAHCIQYGQWRPAGYKHHEGVIHVIEAT